MRRGARDPRDRARLTDQGDRRFRPRFHRCASQNGRLDHGDFRLRDRPGGAAAVAESDTASLWPSANGRPWAPGESTDSERSDRFRATTCVVEPPWPGAPKIVVWKATTGSPPCATTGREDGPGRTPSTEPDRIVCCPLTHTKTSAARSGGSCAGHPGPSRANGTRPEDEIDGCSDQLSPALPSAARRLTRSVWPTVWPTSIGRR